MGVCISPDATITMPKKMSEQLEGKVQIWKASLDENRGVLLLAEEVFLKQTTASQLDVIEHSLGPYLSTVYFSQYILNFKFVHLKL